VPGVKPVEEVNDLGNTYREEKCMRLIRMASHEGALPPLHLVDELALDGVDVTHGPTVDQWLLSFPVRPHLESLHHLYVAPAWSTPVNSHFGISNQRDRAIDAD
jgi:hypothetical protein